MLFGNTEIHASDLSQYYKKLNEIGENETTSIEEHFKVMFGPLHTPLFSLNGINILVICIIFDRKSCEFMPLLSLVISPFCEARFSLK